MKQFILKNDIQRSISVCDSFKEPNFSKKQLLMEVKCLIDKIQPKEWEKSKKILNDYEYIYTSSRTNKNICGIIPVSRSYFKIYEILMDLIGLKKEGRF